MLFRIEDISGFGANLRTYNVEDFSKPIIEKTQIDNYIANLIRDEINGAQGRKILSYSKSLATCLLKYNNFTDNELHICDVNKLNYISYVSKSGMWKFKDYYLKNRINKIPIFKKSGKIMLCNFIIDVSENELLDKYFICYTGVGKKRYASPEKDNEVVVMNPPNDLVINQYMDAVYILYALQLKYNFLSDINITNNLIIELKKMEPFRFEYCPEERVALISLVNYLADNWNYECQISENIYSYSEKKEHISFYYDSILQFHGIMTDSFEEVHYLNSYNSNVVSDLFWKYCQIYLNNKSKYFYNT